MFSVDAEKSSLHIISSLRAALKKMDLSENINSQIIREAEKAVMDIYNSEPETEFSIKGRLFTYNLQNTLIQMIAQNVQVSKDDIQIPKDELIRFYLKRTPS